MGWLVDSSARLPWRPDLHLHEVKADEGLSGVERSCIHFLAMKGRSGRVIGVPSLDLIGEKAGHRLAWVLDENLCELVRKTW